MLAMHDEVSRAARERMSWQLTVGTMLGETLMQGIRQTAELNLGLWKVTLEQGNLAARQLLTARNVEQVMSVAAAQIQPGASRGFDYGYYLSTIAFDAQTGIFRALGGSVDESSREWARWVTRFGDGEAYGWKLMLSLLKEAAGSALRFPADVARAVRLALNLNAPVSETGRLRIAYAAERSSK